MKDPYEILGVARDASDDQIKTAYRNLARKYHPDHYDGNPLSDLAQEKMKEINEAYDQIMAERSGKAGQSQYYGGYSPNHANSSFADIRAIISAGRFEDAQVLLDGVPPQKRDAEWYFLNGSVLYRRGWFAYGAQQSRVYRRAQPAQPAAQRRFFPYQSHRRNNGRWMQRLRRVQRANLRRLLLRMHGRRFDSLLLIGFAVRCRCMVPGLEARREV